MPLLSALPLVKNPDPITPGQAPEVTTSDGRALPLVGALLRGEARGGLARLVLEQTFENRYAETLAVTYRMPLPADGAVSAYAFEIAGRTITGRVDKKQAAREQFEAAIAEGKTAALLEQNRADIFTQEIGNIPGRATLIATITVDVRLAWLPEGEWELRFPTVIGPRYVGGNDSRWLSPTPRARARTVSRRASGSRSRSAMRSSTGASRRRRRTRSRGATGRSRSPARRRSIATS
jgi:hypothetical protein